MNTSVLERGRNSGVDFTVSIVVCFAPSIIMITTVIAREITPRAVKIVSSLNDRMNDNTIKKGVTATVTVT